MVPERPHPPSIAVLPFDNYTGDGRHDITADGLADDLISVLSRVPNFFVISRRSTLVFKNEDRLLQDVGDLFDVRYVVSGSIRVSKGRLHVTAELADAISGVVLGSWRLNDQARPGQTPRKPQRVRTSPAGARCHAQWSTALVTMALAARSGKFSRGWPARFAICLG
jgi:TolB-like protein